MNRVDEKQGFTIIELMLAMSFVSMLLVAVAMTVIQVSNIYNRGIILKDVNQAGRALAVELRQGISQASAFDVGDGTKSTGNYIIQDYGGRLCTGQYSYVWNYGSAFSDLTAQTNKYDKVGSDSIRFIKIFDPTLTYCDKLSTGYPSDIAPEGAVELFSDSQHNLVVHKFNITSGVGDAKTNQRLYNIDFAIGTSDVKAIDSNTNTCKPPSESNADLTYCSINQFDITVRSGNTIN